jgi:hypothetical protein
VRRQKSTNFQVRTLPIVRRCPKRGRSSTWILGVFTQGFCLSSDKRNLWGKSLSLSWLAALPNVRGRVVARRYLRRHARSLTTQTSCPWGKPSKLDFGCRTFRSCSCKQIPLHTTSESFVQWLLDAANGSRPFDPTSTVQPLWTSF